LDLREENVLENVSIAKPCPASWDRMRGNDRVRFCDGCQLNVYNISAMSAADAARLVAETEGRLCLRFYRRADGTILTQDCPVGLAARVRRQAMGWFLAALGLSAIGTAKLAHDSRTLLKMQCEQGVTYVIR
jgi:hypothetical protein